MLVNVATVTASTSISRDVLVPYIPGTIILVIGLIYLPRQLRKFSGLDKVVALGPLFLAVPIAVFGGDHFAAPKVIAGMVPEWIPWHLFWAYFVGVCLISAALSLVIDRHAALAAGLF